jgi:hypothetical protein
MDLSKSIDQTVAMLFSVLASDYADLRACEVGVCCLLLVNLRPVWLG